MADTPANILVGYRVSGGNNISLYASEVIRQHFNPSTGKAMRDTSSGKAMVDETFCERQWSDLIATGVREIHVSDEGNVYILSGTGEIKKYDKNMTLVWTDNNGPNNVSTWYEAYHLVLNIEAGTLYLYIVGEDGTSGVGELVKIRDNGITTTEIWKTLETDGDYYDIITAGDTCITADDSGVYVGGPEQFNFADQINYCLCGFSLSDGTLSWHFDDEIIEDEIRLRPIITMVAYNNVLYCGTSQEYSLAKISNTGSYITSIDTIDTIYKIIEYGGDLYLGSGDDDEGEGAYNVWKVNTSLVIQWKYFHGVVGVASGRDIAINPLWSNEVLVVISRAKGGAGGDDLLVLHSDGTLKCSSTVVQQDFSRCVAALPENIVLP